jgi:hypothetical protein
MKKSWPYLILLGLVLFVLFRASEKTTKNHFDWTENYLGKSKKPFGCFVARKYIGNMMNDQMQETDRTAYQVLSKDTFTNRNYIFVNSTLGLDYMSGSSISALDVVQLCHFVHNGNTVFISAREFGMLIDTLKVEVNDPIRLYLDTATGNVNQVVIDNSKVVEANLSNPNLHLAKNVVFNKAQQGLVFTDFDTTRTVVLGTDGNGHANFIKVKMGKGEFYLHTLPDAFGNYYAADKPTAQYLFGMLSYLQVRPTFFDAHYKSGRAEIENTDIRQYLFQEPALKLAYLVLIATGLLALFFGGKRRQRPVPVVKPHSNMTLEFVEQVGALYYRQGNHSDMAQKKINYFLESIRTRFYTNTNAFDDLFLNRISNMSGIHLETVRQLFETINQVRAAGGCTEKQLRELEKLIRQFNTNSKR